MTKAIVEVIKIDNVNTHPNADALEIVNVGGYQIIVKKDGFKVGDLGLFISVDSIVPDEILEHYGIAQYVRKNRIKTIKLRGSYSQGLLLPLTYPPIANAKIGEDYGEKLNIVKYQPPMKSFRGGSGQMRKRPWPTSNLRHYDIESLQHPKYHHLFKEGDDVQITEKIHGQHMITLITQDGKMHVCSRRVNLMHPTEVDAPWYVHLFKRVVNFILRRKPNTMKPVDGDNKNWEAAIKQDLEHKMDVLMCDLDTDSIAIRGEIYGPKCQPLLYGRTEPEFIVFDIESPIGVYMLPDRTEELCERVDLRHVPVLYKGPFNMKMVEEMAENDSKLAEENGEKKQLSEGVVVRERYPNEYMERKILKQVSKRYLADKASDEEELDA